MKCLKTKPERLDQIPDIGDYYIEGKLYMYLDVEGDVEEIPIKFSLSTNEYPHYISNDVGALSEVLPLIEALQKTLNEFGKEEV